MLALVILAAIILLAAIAVGAIALIAVFGASAHGQDPRQPLPKQTPKRAGRLPEITTPTPPMPIYAADGSLANAATIRAWYREEFEARR